MKKAVLTLACLLCLAPCVFAASPEAENAAEALHELGLFQGTGSAADGSPVYDLDTTPTRNQAVIMLVRLLGKEQSALRGRWQIPFQDVEKGSLSSSYIGYAYTNGLTKGTSADTYSGGAAVTRNQYLLFLLRALGYDGASGYGSGSGMSPADAAQNAAVLGLTDGTETDPFTRGDVALLSYRALDTYMYEIQPGAATLRESLGLGRSPMVQNRPIALHSTRYADYATAYAHISNRNVEEEIAVTDGTLVCFTLGDTPHGTVWCLWHLCADGTRVTLPLPLLNTRGGSAAPRNLSYDGKTGILTYQAVIEAGKSAVPNDPVRRPGTYAYTYNTADRTAAVTELSRN